ncbi:hypothetical protein [Providencia sp. JUb39]|uniref:hypothetical protein n=1 Tax=Providencia sp. JUb39 TaxID=2724165 RepID=UPI00164E15C6|nr:hypothetical protein [Providencia sp. JUb39]MBC5790634.1 hypothetical protein [Providencia sp. JUb39]
MTVSTEISSNEYTGNGVTTDFDYKFRIFKASDLSVTTSDADGDNVVTLRLGTDYTVTGANKSAGGKVILPRPLADKHKISIARDIPITQETSFRNQGKFLAETHEDAFDYLTMIIQRIWGGLGSLFLKRPNILANWFDAKGYRIANLGKPKRDSDAVDLWTLKDEIEGINSTILKRQKRLLRVDDMDIVALPKASDRAGNVLTFDKDGKPIVVAPTTGSAVDVLNKLAGSDGANFIGFNNSTVYKFLSSMSNNVIYSIEYGLDASITADNTEKLRALFDDINDGATVDFCGEAYRVYANVDGVQASSANPATTDALDYSNIVALINKKNITLRNGTIYAANQEVSQTKKYYPSTISFINCVDLHFDNFTAEGRGENYGSADSALAQTKDRRLVHSATNGGHAAYFGRCHGITGNITTLLCGSTSPCYISSCTGVALDTVKSNSASYGYAAFNADNWVGLKEDLGVDYFDVLVGYLEAVAFPIYRREDGANVGLSDVCGKGGGLAEGDGVVIHITSSKIRDMYDSTVNGAGLGYAFGAGSGSKLYSASSHIRKCAYISRLSWGENLHAECIVENTDAVVGLTGVQILKMSFGTGYAKLSGRVKVDKSLVKQNSNIAHYNISSLVANRKITSTVTVDLNVDIDPLSTIDCLIYNDSYACYGGVRFIGGTYYTDGYLMKSQGWGGSSRGSGLGLQAVGGCCFIDRSISATDSYIKYTNKDENGVFTYIYHDMSRAIFKSVKSRQLANYIIEQPLILIENLVINNPQSLFYNNYSRSIVLRMCRALVMEITGLSGENTIIKANVNDNSMIRAGAIGYTSNNNFTVIEDSIAERGDYAGAIFNIKLSGDVRGKLKVNDTVNFILS